ncbi:hypothetical protein [Nannocystis radixulma]|uniref:hypothetical protein n=1 Tax=Nannocystis radixulma TaxID=2995305 RepID=UPI00358DCDDD
MAPRPTSWVANCCSRVAVGRAAGRVRGSPLACMLFHGATVVAAAGGIRDALAAGRSVVVDRYWLSTVVYHRVMGSPCLLDEVASVLPTPDFTVFLHAPLDVRASRVRARGLATEADRPDRRAVPRARARRHRRPLRRARCGRSERRGRRAGRPRRHRSRRARPATSCVWEGQSIHPEPRRSVNLP